MLVVFYAQFTLSKNLHCLEVGTYSQCLECFSDEQIWLTIETLTYYAYMLAIVIYIASY